MILPMSPVLAKFATTVIYTRKMFKRLAQASSNHITLNVLDCVLNLHFKLLWIAEGRPHTSPCLHSVSVYLSVWQSACLSVSPLSLSKNVYKQTHVITLSISVFLSLFLRWLLFDPPQSTKISLRLSLSLPSLSLSLSLSLSFSLFIFVFPFLPSLLPI